MSFLSKHFRNSGSTEVQTIAHLERQPQTFPDENQYLTERSEPTQTWLRVHARPQTERSPLLLQQDATTFSDLLEEVGYPVRGMHAVS